MAAKRREAWYASKRGDTEKHKAARLCMHVEALRKEQFRYRDAAKHWLRLRNGSRDIAGDGVFMGSDRRMRYNLLSSSVDTMLSIVAANRPIPQAVVKGGDWDLQMRAKKRTRALQTMAQELNLFRKAARAYDDGCTVQIGWLVFQRDPDTGGASCERALPLEMIWDQNEARGGSPRSLFRMRLVNREQLKALYPGKAASLDMAEGASPDLLDDFAMTEHAQSCDLVLVVEGWHLPSSSKAGDGKHMIATSTCVLSEQSWKRPRFPAVPLRWAERSVGYMGRSLVEEGRGAQERIHALIEFVEECQDLGSKPQVWVQGNSNVTEEEIDNVGMSVNRYDGDAPPTFFTFDATPTDLVAEIDRIRDQFWSQVGLSQMQLQGEKPAGVNSAVGMRALDDIADGRHTDNIRQYESDMAAAYRALADLLDDIAEADPKFEVHSAHRARLLESTKWADVRIADGDGRIAVFPISSLPSTPAARYERVEELVQAGWITREFALQLHGMPDLEAYEDLETSDLRLAQKQVSEILNGGLAVDHAMSDYQAIDVGLDYARKRLVSAMEEGAPDAILTELEAYIDFAKAKLDRQAAAMAPPPEALPPGAGPGGPGGGVPEALPQDLPISEPPIAAE